MDSIVQPDDPTFGQAMEALARMEQESQADPSKSAPEAVPAPPPTAPESPTPEPQPEGAPATATPDTKPEEKPETKPAEAKPAEAKEPSKYEKAARRQSEAWEQINREKEEVRSLRKELETQRDAIKAEREKLEAKAKETQKPKYTAQDYDAAAEKWESEGKYDLADAARKQARDLRANPPQPDKDAGELEAEFQKSQKEWWGKAAVDFPNVVKESSPEAQALVQLVKSEPAIMNDPKGMYYAARLVTAEIAAARVPAMDKELGEARAKIKELQEKLTVPTDGIVTTAPKGEVPYEQMTPEQQEADTYRLARELDSTGRWQ